MLQSVSAFIEVPCRASGVEHNIRAGGRVKMAKDGVGVAQLMGVRVLRT